MSYQDLLIRLKKEGNFRTIPEDDKGGIIDLSANDYLGIAADADFRRQFLMYAIEENIPLTSSASRLLAGRQREYEKLESRLKDLYGGREVILFNSGYHANTGLIPALAEGKTLILADRLSHASIIDGLVLARVRFERFRHNDYIHLRKLLECKSKDFDRVIVVTESVFSMDGDHADIDALVDVKRDYPKVMLYVDEAHAFGVEGPGGLGLVSASPHSDEIDVIVGTFGKAAASEGAFAAVTPGLRDVIVNRARSLIFSTSIAPINVAWTLATVEKILGMEAERKRLKELSAQLSGVISTITGQESLSSHIQPLIVGDAARAVSLSTHLLKDGFKVLPIRIPTVPAGTERLRFSLCAALKSEDIAQLSQSLIKRFDALQTYS